MLDLAVVIPVYNEEACLVSVLEKWTAALDRLGIVQSREKEYIVGEHRLIFIAVFAEIIYYSVAVARHVRAFERKEGD